MNRQKGYSFINISGLAIGMACCILILMYVTDELSYDKFHEKSDHIYRINAISSIGTTTRHYATVPPALATGLAESIPEIEAFTRLMDQDSIRGDIDGVNVDGVQWHYYEFKKANTDVIYKGIKYGIEMEKVSEFDGITKLYCSKRV